MLPKFITAKEVCARLGGISDMTLWRYLNDDKADFPKPVYIRRRRYFCEQEIADWIEKQRSSAA